MARVKPIDDREADAVCRSVFDEARRIRGEVPNMYRMLARTPELLETGYAHFRAVTADARVPARLKEIVALRVSRLTGCRY
jgi:alkylhydroperoxidase family enzyme